MINLSQIQLDLIASANKKVSWLFVVIDTNDNVYHWSTKDVSVGDGMEWDGLEWDGLEWVSDVDYTFKILSFSGITARRPKSEFSIIAPNDMQITISNKDHVLDPADFIGGRIWVGLHLDDGVDADVVKRWRFNIKNADPGPHAFDLVAEDFFQEILKGDYPNTKYARDVFPIVNIDKDSAVKVPVIFGTAYIPLKYCSVKDAIDLSADTISFVASDNEARCEIKDSVSGFGDIMPGYWVTTTGANNSENNGFFLVLAGSSSGTIYIKEDSGLVDESAGATVAVKQTKSFYLIGKSDVTYTIEKVRRPRKLGAKIEWETGFNQYDITDDNAQEWTLLEPLLIDSDFDGVDETPGFFKYDGSILDLPVKYTNSDTELITNPADVIEWVLKDMGALADDINADSFTAAALTFDTLGLEFNGGFWYNQTRTEALSKLLNMCHVSVYIDDQINIMVIDNASQATITDSEVLKTSDIGVGEFRYSNIVKDTVNDSGYVSWQQDDEAQDKFLKYLISTGTTYNEISDEIFQVPFVQDSILIQKLAKMYYQRKFMEKANINFLGKGTLAGLIPDQTITINEDMFGGNYTCLIDSVTFNEDMSIAVQASVFTGTLNDWGEISATAITPVDDLTTNFFEPVISGPKSAKTVGSSAFEVWGNPNLIVGPNDLRARYTSIQAAINALSESSHSGIFILDGTYQLINPVYFIDRNINITGESQNVIIKNPIGQDGFVFDTLSKKYVIKTMAFESQNTSTASAMIHATSGGNDCDLEVSGVKFTLGTVALDIGLKSILGSGKFFAYDNSFLNGKYQIQCSNDIMIVKTNVHVCSAITDQCIGLLTPNVDGQVVISDNELTGVLRHGIISTANGGKITQNKVTFAESGTFASDAAGVRVGGDNVIISLNEIYKDSTVISSEELLGIASVGSYTGANISNNIVSLKCNNNHYLSGISNFFAKSTISNNSIFLENSHHAHVSIGILNEYPADGSTINGNNIQMLNDANDTGIYLATGSDNNQGSDNITKDVGTSITDNGTNNTVTAKDI